MTQLLLQSVGFHFFTQNLTQSFSGGPHQGEVRVNTPFRSGSRLSGLATVSIAHFLSTASASQHYQAWAGELRFEDNDTGSIDAIIPFQVFTDLGGVSIEGLAFSGMIKLA